VQAVLLPDLTECFLCFQETNDLKKDGERQTEELEELRAANKSLQDQMSRLKQAVSNSQHIPL
jgi:uncharacterized protein YlxW (UPF0749 family)